MTSVLHFIYDPLCGWCYGAEPLVRAAESVEGLELRLRGGGLWPRPTRLPEEARRHIRQADARIASISGQPFGDAYLSGLLNDPTIVLDSRPTIAAVLAAESLGARPGLRMLRAIQHAHYEDGRRVVEPDVLGELAARTGLEGKAFSAAFAAAPVEAHIEATGRLMQRVGARGFPTFVLETGGRLSAVPHRHFAADPAGFRSWLDAELQRRPAAESGA